METMENIGVVWNERDQVFDVLPGYCPYPVTSSGDGTAIACIRAGNCGCDELTKHASSPATQPERAESA